VYDVRPNHGVYYIRTAGALMDPLTAIEMKQRKRVKELGLVSS
jgi:hypothetical protein